MALFSKRYNLIEETKLQKDSLEEGTRNLLWNQMFFLYQAYEPQFEQFSRNVWNIYLKQCIDDFPIKSNGYREIVPDYTTFIKDIFTKEEYYKIYDILEITAKRFDKTCFSEYCNNIFKDENCAYRFVDNCITDITSEEEIQEIEEAINSSERNIKTHLKQALEHLSDRQNPDYRNSVKESISAVEALCRNITNESTLGNALKKLEAKGVVFNSELKKGLEKIYFYTNGEDGIRHALMEADSVTKADAKFMLVICSAFINCIKENMAD